MTTQTKEQQAVALSEMGVVIKAAQEAHAHGLLTGTSNWAAYIYNAVAQQVREAHTAELVANAGVMPHVWSVRTDGSVFETEVCDANEVREAIAALQAQYEQQKADWKEATKKNREIVALLAQSQALVADLERDAAAFRTAAELGLTLRFYGGCAQSSVPGFPSAYEVSTDRDAAEAMRKSIARVKAIYDDATMNKWGVV